ncbi:MAG: DUF1552 domain-containing protein [Nannocystaceae bacterium]
MSAARRRGRRAFLGGAAAMIGLPFLEALAPTRRAQGSAPALPVRLICYYVPNGMLEGAWRPSGVGEGYTLSPTLAPLGDLRGDVSVITGLRNGPADIAGAGHHATGTAGFLTACAARRSETDLDLGVSVDQRYAQAVAGATALDSLQLGIDGGGHVGNCDNGFACAYSRHISWADAASPLPKITDPAFAFDRLFGGDDPEASWRERAQRRALRRSVLDQVVGDARRLDRELGVDDRRRLEDYLESVRALERRIDAAAPSCTTAGFDPTYADLEGHVEVMTALMVMAARCDATRVISFMLGNSASTRTYGFLGVPESHHDLSHNAGDPALLGRLLQIERWEVERFAALLAGLKAIPEGDGSLLDQSLVLLSSEISESNTHSHDDLPVLLAGSAGGAIAPGRHLAYATGTPYARLLVSVLQALGVDCDRFGDDGDGPLDGL